MVVQVYQVAVVQEINQHGVVHHHQIVHLEEKNGAIEEVMDHHQQEQIVV